jgi:hypothetical protein
LALPQANSEELMGDFELSAAEFQALYERLRGHAQWGKDDRRGALNHITPARLLAADQLAMNVHGDVGSHIDALCHVSYQGTLYNGVAPEAVT